MNHDGLVLFAIFANVFEFKTGGKGEVELYGGKLPEAAEDVNQLDVDLGAVEGGFTGDGFVGDAFAVEGAPQAVDG